MTLKPLTETEKNVLGTILNPHPDSQPWGKCCKDDKNDSAQSCQCFARKPKAAPSRMDSFIKFEHTEITKLLAEKGRFFCVHRNDNGFHRECAGWFAKVRSKALVVQLGRQVLPAVSGYTAVPKQERQNVGSFEEGRWSHRSQL